MASLEMLWMKAACWVWSHLVLERSPGSRSRKFPPAGLWWVASAHGKRLSPEFAGARSGAGRVLLGAKRHGGLWGQGLMSSMFSTCGAGSLSSPWCELGVVHNCDMLSWKPGIPHFWLRNSHWSIFCDLQFLSQGRSKEQSKVGRQGFSHVLQENQKWG